MRLEKDDPRLIDFALGELDEQEQRTIEIALQDEENAEARAFVAEMKGLATISEEVLQAETSDSLTAEQREAVLAEVGGVAEAPESNVVPMKPHRWMFRLATIAAMLVVVLGVGILVLPELEKNRLQSSQLAEAPEPATLEMAAPLAKESPTGTVKEQRRRVQHYSDASANKQDVVAKAAPRAAVPPEPAPKPQVAAGDADDGNDEWEDFSVGSMTQQAPLTMQPEAVAAKPPKPEPKTATVPTAVETKQTPAISSVGVDGMGGMTGGGMGPTGTGGMGGPMHEEGRQVYLYTHDGPQLMRGTQHRTNETHAVIQENPFVPVTNKPLSTFSIDVDTGSYSNVRRFLQQGQLPPANAVRVEELINYFDYDYPQPQGKHPFSVNVEVGPCPWQPEHRLAKIGLKGKYVPQEVRPAGNFVFLLDVSGSMKAHNKLPLVKESMKVLLKELRPQDRVGIVTYAGESHVALESTSCELIDTIRQAIDTLHANGGTNGAAGIQLAYDMAARHSITGGINRVIIATDGDFNVGVTNRSDLLQLIGEKAKGGTFLTVLGFGMGNLKDATLEQLADKGNGNYAYIDTFSEARKVLVDQLNGTLVTIAKDVKIQVEFNPHQVQAYRLIGYENRALAAKDFNDDTKDAGEIGAGHTVTALYQIVPAGQTIQPGVDPLKYQPQPEPTAVMPDVPHSNELMTVKLRYKQPEGHKSRKLEMPLRNIQADLNQTTPDFRFAASVAAGGMLLRNSAYKGNTTPDLVLELAESGKGNDPKRQEFIDLVVTAKTLMAP